MLQALLLAVKLTDSISDVAILMPLNQGSAAKAAIPGPCEQDEAVPRGFQQNNMKVQTETMSEQESVIT